MNARDRLMHLLENPPMTITVEEHLENLRLAIMALDEANYEGYEEGKEIVSQLAWEEGQAEGYAEGYADGLEARGEDA